MLLAKIKLLLPVLVILGLLANPAVAKPYVSTEQKQNLIVMENILAKVVTKYGLPEQSKSLLLGMYLRESSLGLRTYAQEKYVKEKYYYLHQGKKVYVSGDIHNTAPSDSKNRKYIYVKYWGKKWFKLLRTDHHGHNPSLGSYGVTEPTARWVIDKMNLIQYNHYTGLSSDKFKSQLRNNVVFNTEITAAYFKINYERARGKYSDPLKRAISKHNGGWNNTKYVNLVLKDVRYINELND